MGFEDFLGKVRKHWFAVILLIIFLYVVGGIFHVSDFVGGAQMSNIREENMAKSYVGGAAPTMAMRSEAYYPPPRQEDFAPEEQDRKITKEASLQSEVKRGAFDDAQDQLHRIVTNAKGFVLNQNVERYGKDQSRTGTYSLKIPANTYDGVVAQLKSIGKVISFNENSVDITGTYLNTEARIPAEQARLQRYKAMYDQWGNLGEKLQLEDRLFQQEQHIQALQDSLKSMNQRVDYSSISVTINEKESDWAQIDFVGISSLATTLVSSLNSVLYFVSAVLPWAVLALVLWWIYRVIKRRLDLPSKVKR